MFILLNNLVQLGLILLLFSGCITHFAFGGALGMVEANIIIGVEYRASCQKINYIDNIITK